MKRLIAFALTLIMVILLCACGENSNSATLHDNSSTPQAMSEKGTISNPYSINDTIEFVSYKVESADYLTGKRTVYAPSTFKLTDMKILDDISLVQDDIIGLPQIIVFNVEIVESSLNEPIYLWHDYSIRFQNISDKGIVGEELALINMEETTGVNDFTDLSLLPTYNAECGYALLVNGESLSLVYLSYYNESGEITNIYIDPYN